MDNAFATGPGIGVIIFYVLLMILLVVSNWKIYEKAGQPGWAALIPIYNIVVLFKIVNKPLWWILMFFIPIANIIFMIKLYHALSLAFGKGAGFTVGLILLGFVFMPILAFGDAKYVLNDNSLENKLDDFGTQEADVNMEEA